MQSLALTRLVVLKYGKRDMINRRFKEMSFETMPVGSLKHCSCVLISTCRVFTHRNNFNCSNYSSRKGSLLKNIQVKYFCLSLGSEFFFNVEKKAHYGIHTLLKLALTLPIISCECERSFSQLKLIKTACRSTTTSANLSGLSLMKINRDKCERIYNSKTEINSLVLTFNQTHPRRMKLPFLLTD